MSFDLRNAARTFQRFMEEILRWFDFCFAYIDEILVYSHTGARAINTNTLQAATGLRDLAQPWQMCFLSHRILVPWIQDLRQWLTAAANRVADLPRQSISFEGYWGCSRRSHTNISAHPPRRPTQQMFAIHQLDTRTQPSLRGCRSILSRATILPHQVRNAPFALVTDASTTAMGAVLQQWTKDSRQPLTFF